MGLRSATAGGITAWSRCRQRVPSAINFRLVISEIASESDHQHSCSHVEEYGAQVQYESILCLDHYNDAYIFRVSWTCKTLTARQLKAVTLSS